MNAQRNWSTALDSELHELLTALLDERLTTEAQHRLEQLLSDYPEARRLYLDYFELHNELYWRDGAAVSSLNPATLAHGGPSPSSVQPGKTATRQKVLTGLRRTTPWIIAVSVLLAAGLIGRTFFLQTAPSETPTAVVIATVDAVWSDGRSPLAAGDEFPAGDFGLETGRATIRASNGAEVSLAAPVRGRLESPSLLRIDAGRATVRCETDTSIGFRVVTPAAEMIDLGTEFGVQVEASGTSEIHVFEGVVLVRLDSQKVVPVYRNEAGQVSVAQDSADLMAGELISIPVEPSKFMVRRHPPSVPATIEHAARPQRPLGEYPRIVFLGDYDGAHEIHLLLINQALRDLPEALAPQLFNSTAAYSMWSQDDSDFEQHIRRFRPTHVVIDYGRFQLDANRDDIGQVLRNVRRAIESLLSRLDEAGIEPILVTVRPLANRNDTSRAFADLYNDMLRELAIQRGDRLADAARRFESVSGGFEWTNSRGALTFEGARVLAAELLATMGYGGVVVPDQLDLELMPGVITSWNYRFKPKDDRLTEESVATVEPDDSWQALLLPQEDKFGDRLPDPSHSFAHALYARGFAIPPRRQPGTLVEAVSHIESAADRDVWFNPGAGVQTVWLNGKRIYNQGDAWHGWHPGKARVPARLRAGRNRVVIESSNAFFLSVTDVPDWPLPRPAPNR
jgi:hypothetical protein